MGCGFSSAGDKLTASDEERILNNTESNSTSAKTNNNSGMGGSQSKSKSKRKSNQGNISEFSSDKKLQNGKSTTTNGRKTTPALSGFPASPFNIQSEVSTSQVNFFKMLDEKIENGDEPEEQDSEQERQNRLQRVAEEWNDLLGRSQDSHELQLKHSQMASPEVEDEGHVHNAANGDPPQEGSVNSMRTMFSNSVTLPAGTFREIDHSATDAINDVK